MTSIPLARPQVFDSLPERERLTTSQYGTPAARLDAMSAVSENQFSSARFSFVHGIEGCPQ